MKLNWQRLREQCRRNKSWRLIALFALLMLLAWYVSTFYFQIMLLQGDSMSPTYRSGELLLLDKRNTQPEAGDVIAFRQENLGGLLVKRVAAGPGDEVTLNGESYLLQTGEYYVLGDNAEHSVDSRDARIGIVESDAIVGKVLPQRSLDD